MLLIILGSDGMLGRYVYKYMKENCGYNVLGYTRSILDATNLVDSRNKMLEILQEGDIVINCIGITNKRTDLPDTDMYIVNSIFPHIIDRVCFSKNCHFIHASTDCVFKGDIGGYTNASVKDNDDSYGLSKSIGEEIKGSVIRVSIIGDENKRQTNLVSWLKSQREGKVYGYTDHYWNGITCLKWAQIVSDIIEKKDYWSGVRIYHSTYKGNNYITKAELLKCLDKYYSLCIQVVDTKSGKNIDRTMYGIQVDTDLEEQVREMVGYFE